MRRKSCAMIGGFEQKWDGVMNVDESMVNGRFAPEFEPVYAQFVENFRAGKEVGAACAVYYQGECVVDLWGGYQDVRQRKLWREDTLALVFSSSKGVAALCLAMAHARGWFDYDAPVSDYWPEFAQNGKGSITIRQLLAHQAGLCAMDIPLSMGDLGDLTYVDAVIAAQKPIWEPGDYQGYHTYSMGWYMNGLMRHVDANGRSIGQFLKQEVAAPLGLDMRLSFANETAAEIVELEARLAHFYSPVPLLEAATNLHNINRQFAREFLRPSSLTSRSFASPKVRGFEDWNKRPLRSVELPSSNVICTVRDLARLYGMAATGGAALGLDERTMEMLKAEAVPPRKDSLDLVMQAHTSFSLGFNKPTQRHQFGTTTAAFGTPGAGGSFGYADPATGVGFAYAMNKPGYYLVNDPREDALSRAVFDCVAALK